VDDGDHSWSWSLVPARGEAPTLAVGIRKTPAIPQSLTVVVLESDQKFTREASPPAPPGEPWEVYSSTFGDGALIAGTTRVDGRDQAFAFRSRDRITWEPVEVSADRIQAVTGDGEESYFASGMDVVVVDAQGTATRHRVAEPRPTDRVRDLAVDGDRLVALLSTEDEQDRIAISEDRGTTWAAPGATLTATGGDGQFIATGLAGADGQILVTGSCSIDGKSYACLERSPDGRDWSSEEPFGTSGLSRLITPTLDESGVLVTAATTAYTFAEGWPCVRYVGGAWQGARRGDLLGEIGTVVAIAAQTRGAGWAVITTTSYGTEVEFLQTLSGPSTGSRLGGPPGTALRLEQPGTKLSARAGFYLERSTKSQTYSIGYFSVPRLTPLILRDEQVVSAEWRPFAGSEMIKSKTAEIDSTTLLVGLDQPESASYGGELHIYLTSGHGLWSDLGSGLADGQRVAQLPTAVSGTAGGWLVGIKDVTPNRGSPRLIVLSTSATPKDWTAEPVKLDDGASDAAITAFCSPTNGKAVAVGYQTGSTDHATIWTRDGGTWLPSAAAEPALALTSCAQVGAGMLMLAAGDDGPTLWRRSEDGHIAKLPTPEGLRSEVLTPVDDGVATIGSTSDGNARKLAVLFTRDGQTWTTLPLPFTAMASQPQARQTEAMLLADGADLVVLALTDAGMSAWRVRPAA